MGTTKLMPWPKLIEAAESGKGLRLDADETAQLWTDVKRAVRERWPINEDD